MHVFPIRALLHACLLMGKIPDFCSYESLCHVDFRSWDSGAKHRSLFFLRIPATGGDLAQLLGRLYDVLFFPSLFLIPSSIISLHGKLLLSRNGLISGRIWWRGLGRDMHGKVCMKVLVGFLNGSKLAFQLPLTIYIYTHSYI